MNGGSLPDGTPYVCIGNEEPEADEFIVHCECEQCGKVHHFDLWAMVRGETIVCEHCGHESVAKRQRYNAVTEEWEELPPTQKGYRQ